MRGGHGDRAGGREYSGSRTENPDRMCPDSRNTNNKSRTYFESNAVKRVPARNPSISASWLVVEIYRVAVREQETEHQGRMALCIARCDHAGGQTGGEGRQEQ